MTATTTKAKKAKKAKKSATSHVILKMDTSEMACLHCGETYAMTLPVSIDMFVAMSKTFTKGHRHCKPKSGVACTFCMGFGHAESDCPRMTYFNDIRRWAAGPDTGISSCAIARKLIPPGLVVAFRETHPLDPFDFGRCHRLLAAFPEWRGRIGEMASVSPVWKKLAENWDELEALYREELPSGNGPKLYARMKELGA